MQIATKNLTYTDCVQDIFVAKLCSSPSFSFPPHECCHVPIKAAAYMYFIMKFVI